MPNNKKNQNYFIQQFVIQFIVERNIIFLFFFVKYLQAELADALRKRKSRSDASEEDLGLPRSPSTPPRSGNHQVDGHNNSNSSNGNHHHSSLGILSMTSSEIYDDSIDSIGYLSQSKSSYEIGSKFDEFDLNVTRESETKLSHSAAKHKMAIRPKKKGPSRPPRKPIEVYNFIDKLVIRRNNNNK